MIPRTTTSISHEQDTIRENQEIRLAQTSKEMCQFSSTGVLVILSKGPFFRIRLCAALAAMHGESREQALWFGCCVHEVNVLIRERSPQVDEKAESGERTYKARKKRKEESIDRLGGD